MFGVAYLDPIASIIIALFILRLGVKIIMTGVSQVVDKAASDDVKKQIEDIIFSCPEVKSIDEMKTRQFGQKLYVDLEIGLEHSLSLESAHDIAEKIHNKIEKQVPDVLHCMIHINPYYSNK